MKMSKLGLIRHFLSPVSCDSLVWQGLRCVKFGVIALTLSYWSLEVHHGTSWQRTLMIWKKELLLYIKMAWAIRRLPRPWNWAAAQWPRPYSSLTGQVPLRTGLAMVDQRHWVHVLSVVSRGKYFSTVYIYFQYNLSKYMKSGNKTPH